MSTTGGSVAHWDEVYRSKGGEDVSWFESDPTTSRRLLLETGHVPTSVVDVGGGASALAGVLVDAGIRDLTVVDLSAEALALGRARSSHADAIGWVTADVRTWTPDRHWSAWHDRAVLHFLTADDERRRYAEVASRSVEPGGRLVIGCFAPEGPEQCSGLPVRRASADELAALFAPAFELLLSEVDVHTTPWGAEQPFTWVVLERVGAG